MERSADTERSEITLAQLGTESETAPAVRARPELLDPALLVPDDERVASQVRVGEAALDQMGNREPRDEDAYARSTDVGLTALPRIPARRQSRRRIRARATRLAPPRSYVLIGAPVVVSVLLATVVMAVLGGQHWTAFGLAAAPSPDAWPTAVDARAPVATPAPEPTDVPTSPPSPNLRRNAAMGCASGAPAPSPAVVFGSKNYETGGPAPNEVALTFDDGPTPYTSPPILDYLEQTHTPATFFVLGLYARSWPDIIQREWRDGFAIGVHTWDHSSMPLVPDDRMAHQFGDTIAAIHAAIGEDACIWFWRPPYGDYNGHVIGFAQRYGLTTIQWNDDPRDWARPGPEAIARVVLAEARPGSIVVMHDGPAHREQTTAALPLILAGLRARGLTPVTIPRLLADSHYPGVATNLDHRRTPPD